MTPTELYRIYLSGYLYQSKDDRQQFLSHLRTFDFSSFRLTSQTLYEAWLATPVLEPKRKFLTGGSSTGVPSEYFFEPYEVMMDIENIQKAGGGDILWLSGTQQDLPHVGFNRHRTTFRFKYDGSNLDELFYYISSHHDRTGKQLNLCSMPHNYLYLTSHPRFVDFLLSNRKPIRSLVSTDWEPLFKRAYLTSNGIHINNCMIDWTTGLNFHTCRFSKDHFFPIFVMADGKFANWLNLADRGITHTYDQIEIQSTKPVKCLCGLSSIGVRVVPRESVIFPFRRDLGELLKSHYTNLQFVRSENRLQIFYATVGSFLDCDRQFLDAIFSDYDVFYIPNKLGMTGTKWPAFWDTKIAAIREVDFKY